MKKCENCDQRILFGGLEEDGRAFCSRTCKDSFYVLQKTFCKKCTSETISEDSGKMIKVNLIGTGWGWFSKNECSECGSVVKRKWFFFIIPIIPFDQYRLFESAAFSTGLGSYATRFKARLLKEGASFVTAADNSLHTKAAYTKVQRMILIATSILSITGLVLHMTSTPNNPLITVIPLLAITGSVAAFLYAKNLHRNAVGYAFGSFVFPYVFPLVLAFMKPVSPRAGRTEENSVDGKHP